MIKMMKQFTLILIVIISIFACKKKEKLPKNLHYKDVEKINTVQKKTDTISSEKNDEFDFSKLEVFAEDDILFNGKVKRFFSLNEFENVFGKVDSTQLLLKMDLCTSIFEEEDGSVDSTNRYLYKYGSSFENSKEKVAVEEFKFQNGSFVLFKRKKLDENTSLEDLIKLFPYATKWIGTMDVYGEGELSVIELREDENNISDGHVKMFVKNGKLYMFHWWFPC